MSNDTLAMRQNMADYLADEESARSGKAAAFIASLCLAAAPGGAGLSEIAKKYMDVKFSSFQREKQNQLMEFIINSHETLSEELLDNVEFIADAVKIVATVNRLSTNSKITYFAKLLTNGFGTMPHISSDEFDECVELIERLSNRQITLLLLWYQESVRYERENPGSERRALEHASKIQNRVISAIEENGLSRKTAFSSLIQTGFLMPVVGSYLSYNGGVYQLSYGFDDLVKWISDMHPDASGMPSENDSNV